MSENKRIKIQTSDILRDWICSHTKRHAYVIRFSDRKILCIQTAHLDRNCNLRWAIEFVFRSISGVGSSDSQWLDGVDSGFNIGDGAGGCSDSGLVVSEIGDDYGSINSSCGDYVYASSKFGYD